MALQKRQSNGITILEPIGNHTYRSDDFNLKSTVSKAIDEGVKKFVINLSGIRKMDSSGLGELVLIHQMIYQEHGMVKLCSLTKEISSLINLTKLNVKFESFNTESSAINSFR